MAANKPSCDRPKAENPRAPRGAPFLLSGKGLQLPVTTWIEKQDPSHAEGLWVALADPRIYRFLDDAPPSDREQLRQRLLRLALGGSADGSEIWYNWTVFHDSQIVGYTQATVHDDRSASIAYVLAPAVWGRGVAYCACQQMIRHLLQAVRPLVFTADAVIGNLRSRRLLERLGFILEREDETDACYRATPAMLADRLPPYPPR